jgi:hypothetical protein
MNLKIKKQKEQVSMHREEDGTVARDSSREGERAKKNNKGSVPMM